MRFKIQTGSSSLQALIALGVSLLFFLSGSGQEVFCQDLDQEPGDSIRLQLPVYTADFGPGILRTHSALPVSVIVRGEFNAGNISDPLQLIQGKVSGLLITRAGNDPNEPFSARLRGINSIYLSSSPLIIIDGMPYASLLNVDPWDIARMTVVKDAATAAQFGINSQSGVIVIETRHGDEHKLNVRHYTAFETSLNRPEVSLSGADYVNAGGTDLGSPIDWRKEITRNALSSATAVSYGDKIGETTYYGSLHYRDINGVLEGSGFDMYNGMARVSQGLFRNRLTISGNVALTHRDNSFSFPEAFKYATTFNPTSPIFYTYGGGYREYLVFDSFNPEAMIHQNIHDGSTNIWRVGGSVNYSPTDNLQIKAGFSSESQKNDVRKYWSREAYWMNYYKNGYREQLTQRLKTNYGYASATYSKNINGTSVEVNGSLSLQNLDFADTHIAADNFLTDAEGQAETIPQENWRSIASFNKNLGITSYRGTFATNSWDQLFFQANLSHEVYSDHLKGTTFGVAAAYDLMATTQGALQSLKPKLSFGKSSGALAFFQNYNSSNIVQSWRSLSDNQIRPEKKEEVTAGMEWAFHTLNGSINFFRAMNKDVVTLNYLTTDGQTFMPTLINNARIRNTGIEIDLNWTILNSERVQLQTSINFSSIRNTFLTEEEPVGYQPLEFILGHGATNLYALENNKPIGQFVGFANEGIVNNHWKFKDLDNSGGLSTGDLTTFGKPLPSSFFGWTTSFTMDRWSATILFRGAWGHSLLNSTRGAYENPFFIQGYNTTPKAIVPPLKTLEDGNYPSDYYLEDASFITLDNLAVSYQLFRDPRHRPQCTLNVAVQNLFVLSGYSGTSPEVRVDYYGTQYAAGYDSQYTYASSRTFLVGVHFSL